MNEKNHILVVNPHEKLLAVKNFSDSIFCPTPN